MIGVNLMDKIKMFLEWLLVFVALIFVVYCFFWLAGLLLWLLGLALLAVLAYVIVMIVRQRHHQNKN